MKSNKVANVIGVISLVLSAVLAVGVKTFFDACDPKEDGSWMSCHWAEQAVFGVAILLAVLAALLIVCKRADTKKGIAIAIIPTALLNLVIPGYLIDLCMMADMRCHATMTPAVRVLSVAIAVVALVEVILLSIKSRRDRKALAAGADYEEPAYAPAAPAAAESQQTDAYAPVEEPAYTPSDDSLQDAAAASEYIVSEPGEEGELQ